MGLNTNQTQKNPKLSESIRSLRKSKDSSDSAKKTNPMKAYLNLSKPIKAIKYFWGERKYFLRYKAEWIGLQSQRQLSEALGSSRERGRITYTGG